MVWIHDGTTKGDWRRRNARNYARETSSRCRYGYAFWNSQKGEIIWRLWWTAFDWSRSISQESIEIYWWQFRDIGGGIDHLGHQQMSSTLCHPHSKIATNSKWCIKNMIFNDKKDQFYFYRVNLFARREKLGKKCILSGMNHTVWFVKKTSSDRYFSSGKVQVCGATPAQVFCTLNVGVAFGEISLLTMGEGNKRTANIYSEWDHEIATIYKLRIKILVKWCTSSRWSFGPNSTCGNIETTTIGKTHPTLQFCTYLDHPKKPGFTTMFTLNKTDLFNALGPLS